MRNKRVGLFEQFADPQDPLFANIIFQHLSGLRFKQPREVFPGQAETRRYLINGGVLLDLRPDDILRRPYVGMEAFFDRCPVFCHGGSDKFRV